MRHVIPIAILTLLAIASCVRGPASNTTGTPVSPVVRVSAIATTTAPPTVVSGATSGLPPRTPTSSVARSTPPRLQTSLSLHMFTPTTGWAIRAQAAVLMASGPASFTLLHTTDSGAQWQNVGPPGVLEGARFRVDFLDAERAWLVTPGQAPNVIAIWRTTDGGAKWQESMLSVPLRMSAPAGASPIFIDPQHGWLLVNPSQERAACAPAALYATADGGNTWQLVSSTDAAAPGHLPFAGTITFQSSRHGWLEISPPCVGLGLLYATEDGGRTWRRISLPLPPGRQGTLRLEGPPSLLPPDRQAGFLAAQFIPADRSQAAFAAVLFITHDGGRSWTPDVLPSQGEVTFVTGEDGWLWEPPTADGRGGGVLLRTHDAGHTWEVVPSASKRESLLQAGGDVGHLQFVTPRIGWATVFPADRPSTEILHTTDGGRTWLMIYPRKAA